MAKNKKTKKSKKVLRMYWATIKTANYTKTVPVIDSSKKKAEKALKEEFKIATSIEVKRIFLEKPRVLHSLGAVYPVNSSELIPNQSQLG